jgi:hypothetical protein
MPSVEDLVKDVAAAGLGGHVSAVVQAKWRLAKHVAERLDSVVNGRDRTSVSEDLGGRIGVALGRGPDSGSWVRQQAAAYRKFQVEPKTEDERAAFIAKVNGNAASRTRTA